MHESRNDVTHLLIASRNGDWRARNRLFELVYDELGKIARRCRFAGRTVDAMQPGALINETYIRFSERFPDMQAQRLPDRETFLLTVAITMRNIAIDRRRRVRAKRRGGTSSVSGLAEYEVHDPRQLWSLGLPDLLALHGALKHLQTHNPRWFEFVTQRYLAGRTIEETAHIAGLEPNAVKRQVRKALIWLRQELGRRPQS